MRTPDLLKSIALLILALVYLVACQSTATTGTVSMTSEPTATAHPQPSVTPSPTPSPAPTLTPTYVLPPGMPDIFHQPIADRLLFAKNENCVLPCWFGLRVGVSRADEIAPAFRRAVGLPEDYTFSEGQYDEERSYVGGSWVLLGDTSVQGDPPSVVIEAYFDPQSGILEELYLRWRSFSDYPTTPQHIMRELGAPTVVLVDYSPYVTSGDVLLHVQLFYLQEGIVIELAFSLPVQQQEQNSAFAEWCLNGGKSYDEYTVASTILSLSQAGEWAKWQATSWYPLEDVFGITLEALYQRAVQENDACLPWSFTPQG